MMAHNTTVQLGGNAFLMCKVAGVDRVGVNWVCFWCWFSSLLLFECPEFIHQSLPNNIQLRWIILSRNIYINLAPILFFFCFKFCWKYFCSDSVHLFWIVHKLCVTQHIQMFIALKRNRHQNKFSAKMQEIVRRKASFVVNVCMCISVEIIKT